MSDYYRYLEVSPDASSDEIKKAYRRLVRLYHPDASSSEEAKNRFREIQEAYDVLSDSEKRDRYDQQHRHVENVQKYQTNQAAADAKKADSKKADAQPTDENRSRRQWDTLHSYNRNRKDDPGANESKFEPHKDGIKEVLRDAPSSVFKKIKRAVISSVSGSAGKKAVSSRTAPTKRGARPLEPERFYQFSITALESLSDTYRELALEDGDKPRIIRVRIPGGVRDGTMLKVNCPETDTAPARQASVKIRITPHPYVERDGNDIVLNIPVTVSEAMNGEQIEVPTFDGPAKIKLPTPWSPDGKIKLTSRGLPSTDGHSRGDIYVKTFIVLPEIASEAAKQAAMVLDEFYTGPVRRAVPLRFDTKDKS